MLISGEDPIMKLKRKSAVPAVKPATGSGGWTMDRRAFLRNSGLVAGGVAAAVMVTSLVK